MAARISDRLAPPRGNSRWWEFFRLRELPEEDSLDEPKALAGLVHVAEVGPVLSKKGKLNGSTIHRYQFPPQEVELKEGDDLQRQDGKPFGEVLALDRVNRTIDIKRGKASGDDHPSAAFSLDVVPTQKQQESVMRFARRLHAAGYTETSAEADLLYRRAPRVRDTIFERQQDESTTDFAVRITTKLDQTTLAIQGPPGAGKTHVGAQMIRSAVAEGLRVGVTATSHKVIQNLLEAVEKQAAEAGEELQACCKGEELSPTIKALKDNAAALSEPRSPASMSRPARTQIEAMRSSRWSMAPATAAGSFRPQAWQNAQSVSAPAAQWGQKRPAIRPAHRSRVYVRCSRHLSPCLPPCRRRAHSHAS